MVKHSSQDKSRKKERNGSPLQSGSAQGQAQEAEFDLGQDLEAELAQVMVAIRMKNSLNLR